MTEGHGDDLVVLSGFSGQPMGDDDGGPRDVVAGQFIDARSNTAEGETYGSDQPLESKGSFDDEVELTGGVTIIGTDDPVTTPGTVDNIYTHELGHVLGAIHPGSDSESNSFEVPYGTDGVMCKYSCAIDQATEIGLERLINELISRSPAGGERVDIADEVSEREYILNSERYSKENKKRILDIGYDYKDDGGSPEAGGENIARNLTSVSTAATSNP
jgi:hypothetical protein